jgi:hypothetical protein
MGEDTAQTILGLTTLLVGLISGVLFFLRWDFRYDRSERPLKFGCAGGVMAYLFIILLFVWLSTFD